MTAYFRLGGRRRRNLGTGERKGKMGSKEEEEEEEDVKRRRVVGGWTMILPGKCVG